MPRIEAIPANGRDMQSTGAGTRERLRRVALDLFWEKGYRKTSTRDLAAALGVQQGSLYYHVKKKEDLLYDICYSSLERVMQQVEAAANSTGNPLESLRRITRAHMIATLELQREMLVSMYDYRSLSAECNREINAFWSGYEQKVTSIYDAAIAAGAMRAGIPHRYHYHAVMSMTNWPVLWFRREGALPLESLADIFSNLYLEGAAQPGVRIDLSNSRETISALEPGRRPICETKNETHERLLDTSSMLFATRGFTTTSIQEVADTMGIEKASLYYYIKSKDDLCYQIIRSAHEYMLHAVTGALKTVRGAEARLLCLIVVHVAALLEHKHWLAVANEQINFLDAKKRAEVVALRDAYETIVRQILCAAQKEGVLRSDVPARYLGFALLGIITHIYPWYEEAIDLAPRALAELLADFFLHGIRSQRK
jgi:TetR/AcrR family transcriptional regulator, cholesterol catabolism regulator